MANIGGYSKDHECGKISNGAIEKYAAISLGTNYGLLTLNILISIHDTTVKVLQLIHWHLSIQNNGALLKVTSIFCTSAVTL